MENLKEIFKDKKNLIGLLILLIILVAVPLTLRLMQQQQTLRSRAQQAGAAGVTFSGPNVSVRNNKTILKLQVNEEGTTEAKVDLIITSPLGGASQSATQSGGTR